MIIDLNSLTKMIWLLYYRFFDYQQIILKDVECKLDGGISIKLYLQYYHVETVVDVLIDGVDWIVKDSLKDLRI